VDFNSGVKRKSAQTQQTVLQILTLTTEMNTQSHVKNSDCSCWDFSGRCFRKQLM